MAAPRTTAHTLNDVARQLAPHLQIISSSQPTPPLRTHNVIAVAETAELGRRAVLALESVENDDERLGTVVMGTTRQMSTERPGSRSGRRHPRGRPAHAGRRTRRSRRRRRS